MKREKLLASGAWLLMVSAIVAQSPVDGGKVPSPLSPYGQIGSAVIKKEQVANEKKDLELPASGSFKRIISMRDCNRNLSSSLIAFA